MRAALSVALRLGWLVILWLAFVAGFEGAVNVAFTFTTIGLVMWGSTIFIDDYRLTEVFKNLHLPAKREAIFDDLTAIVSTAFLAWHGAIFLLALYLTGWAFKWRLWDRVSEAREAKS